MGILTFGDIKVGSYYHLTNGSGWNMYYCNNLAEVTDSSGQIKIKTCFDLWDKINKCWLVNQIDLIGFRDTSIVKSGDQIKELSEKNLPEEILPRNGILQVEPSLKMVWRNGYAVLTDVPLKTDEVFNY